MTHYKSLEDYVDYYNKARLHRSLDFDNCETPRQAFHRKMANKAVREGSPEWAEEDENDWATSFPYNTLTTPHQTYSDAEKFFTIIAGQS